MATTKTRARGKKVVEPSSWEKTLETYSQNRRKALGVAGIVVAIIVLAIAASWYSGKVEEDAAAEFEEVAFMDPGPERTEELRTLVEKYAGTPIGLRAKYRLAADYLDERRNEEARTLLQEIIESSPRSYFAPMSWKLLGDIISEEGNLDLAIEKYQHVTQTFSDTVAAGAAWLELGFCYEQKEDWDQAREAYELAIPSFQVLAVQRLDRVRELSGVSLEEEIKLDLGPGLDPLIIRGVQPPGS